MKFLYNHIYLSFITDLQFISRFFCVLMKFSNYLKKTFIYIIIAMSGGVLKYDYIISINLLWLSKLWSTLNKFFSYISKC